eukprot:CAMPEP_0182916754 /NCGR_PEP_ID=MMETSP0105_2-20130417/1129_1 /TAXON_ID=81532 ORGANISM="Acanthoeca-like sp., Strain 10tr" /NCGR_SAMPLE_ID=MMETSP0105_2 /ASSEMBLY_ACC=CAM_ASM_000205 /LENGTH=532 /DNA_ID=CAMNT_0025053719 /DNA_START=29 /DNA_END=1627 /DNA_ORIENTATION=+
MSRCVVAVLSVLATAAGNTVWPKPQSQADSGTTFMLDGSSFEFTGEGAGAGSAILLDGFKRYEGIIGITDAARSSVRHGAAPLETITGCRVTVTSADETLALETDESYKLVVAAPTMTISAPTVFGALNGLETLSQLISHAMEVNGTTITDHPRYQFRATMIDTSRHYYPVEVILQHLDAMAYAKFNTLHWHIVDSVSFPFQSTTFPEMSVQGAYSPNHVYTHDDIGTVVAYAKARGIRVIPEFDTPGHVEQGYLALDPPILTSCYTDGQPSGETGPLDPTSNATYTFLKQFYAEVKSVFPDKFVHVGGDEVPSDCWASNPAIQKYMADHNLKSFADLETLYEQQLLNILKDQGTSYIVWQEIYDNGAKILPDTVIDVWKGGNWQEEIANVTRDGFHAVLSAPFYLNYISYGEDWPKYYTVEPSNFTGGEAADAKGLVGGVEVCMWSEFVDAANFIPREWARSAAVSERGWSAKEVRDVDEARFRLHEFRCKLLERGIPAEPITNGGNEQELNLHNFCPREWVPHYVRPWTG